MRIRPLGDIALFSSILRDKLTDNSDIDILVTMAPGQNQNTLHLKTYLQHQFGRKVDIAVQERLRPILRSHIEGSAHHA